MNKCKAIGMLNDARDNVFSLMRNELGHDCNIDVTTFEDEIHHLEKAIANPTAFAMDILRHEMKDKSEGSLYHAWMCNIKYSVYDSIINEYDWADDDMKNMLSIQCEDGAKVFLDRLLQDESN